MNKKLFLEIANFSRAYRETYLSGYDPNLLITDWWAAFDFFLGRACYQGRRDDLSRRVYFEITSVLFQVFSQEHKTSNYEKFYDESWKTIESELSNRIGKGKVGKYRDIEMVLSGLNFIEPLPDLNLVNYSLGKIQSNLIEQHYQEIQPSWSRNGITQVGPKIAAFYLRDLVSLFQLENLISNDFAFYLQPIDTWVEKLTKRIGIVEEGANHDEIRARIVAICQQFEVSPLQFNQGAWYLGYHSFEILVNKLMEDE